MKPLFNKNNCLVNVSSSLLKHYGIEPFHPSLPSLDRILEKTDKKICLVLFDGFGTYIRKVYHRNCLDIDAHFFTEITSVFPPTTVAATTSLLTDKFPLETGWLGWTEQFPQYERAVTMFASSFAQEPVEPIGVSTYDLLPYTTIFDLLSKKGIQNDKVQSFALEDKSIETFFAATDKKLKENQFLYAYCCEPDSSLHEYGVGSKEVRDLVDKINQGMVHIARKNKDTLFIVLADHGHRNAIGDPIDEHPDFFSLLRYKHYALEGRAAFFYLKEGKEAEFKKLAKQYYGKHYEILTKEEVIQKHVFGYGKPCKQFESLLGDFLLISKDSHVFLQVEDDHPLVSHHAGSSDEEKYIDISIFNR